MFSHIRTSKENKEIVAKLTYKFNLGSENVIARIALTYSLAHGDKMDLNEMKDSGGKSYSNAVLFGEYLNYYIGLTAVHYNLHTSDSDLPKFIKMHIDDGLDLINKELNSKNVEGYSYLIDLINQGLEKECL